MICYKDRTFCPYYPICKHGYTCDRAYTDKVRAAAEAWWGKEGAPVAVYAEFPGCFVRWFEPDDNVVED